MFNGYCGELFVINFIKFFYLDSGTSVGCKPFTHVRGERVLFGNVQKSLKCLVEIVTLVATVNIMGTDKVFVAGGRSFM
jgi:hypothetical protein